MTQPQQHSGGGGPTISVRAAVVKARRAPAASRAGAGFSTMLSGSGVHRAPVMVEKTVSTVPAAATAASSSSPAAAAQRGAGNSSMDLTGSDSAAALPAASASSSSRTGRAPPRAPSSALPPRPPSSTAASAAGASARPAPPAESSGPPTLQCMLCGTSLAMLPLDERQKHINRCLDQMSAPSAPAALPTLARAMAKQPSLLSPVTSAAFTPQKRKSQGKRDSSATPPAKLARAPSIVGSAAAASSFVSAATPSPKGSPEVCVIDDDDDEPMPAQPSSLLSPASPASAAAAANGTARRSITDFFGGGRSTSKATVAGASSPSSATRKSALSPASAAAPPLKRAQTIPLPDAPGSSSSSSAAAAASPSSSAEAEFVKATSAAIAVADAAAAAASLFAAEKTKDVWNMLLTGRKSGSIAAAPANNRGGAAASGKKKHGEPELDEHGMPLTSMPQGNISGSNVSRYGGQRGGGLPSHKRVPGTSILPDAFMFTRTIQSMPFPADDPPLFFLSHFHADHYAGLTSKWSAGSIFCSAITARLVRNAFGAGPHVVVLPLHERIEIGGTRVTLIDAHHCPGAVIFIFETKPFAPAPPGSINYSFLSEEVQEQRKKEDEEAWRAQQAAAASSSAAAADADPASLLRARKAGLPHGRVYVHGGDMRYHQSMRELFLPNVAPAPMPTWSKAISAAPSPFLPDTYVPCAYPSTPFKANLKHLAQLSIHSVYLDTTYCNPRYTFPPQSISVSHALAVVGEELARESRAGVSALVDASAGSKGVKSKLDFFKPYTPATRGANIKEAGASTHAAAATGSLPASDLSIEGVSAFLTQVSPAAAASATSSSSSPAAAAVACEIDSASSPAAAAAFEDTTAAASASMDEGPQQIDRSEAQDGCEYEHSHDHEHEGEDEDEDDDGEEELVDLMMRDFDRPNEDDPDPEEDDEHVHDHGTGEEEMRDGASSAAAASSTPAAASSSSSSAVGGALSSLWSSVSSTVSSSLSSVRANLALSSGFLNGYRRAAAARTLFLVGSYSIGKEKIFIEIARQFGMRIWVPPYRIRTIRMLELFDEVPPPQAETTATGAAGTSADVSSATPAASSSSSAASSAASSASTLAVPATSFASASSSAASSSSSSPSASPSKTSTHFSAPQAPSSAHIQREWARWDLDSVLTTDITAARLHVVPLSYMNFKNIGSHLDPSLNTHMPGEYIERFHNVVAFRPTGWVGNKPTRSEKVVRVTIPGPTKLVKDPAWSEFNARGQRKGGRPKMVRVPCGPSRTHALSVAVHGVPYSEHSTFPELSQFVETLAECGLTEIVPTVNVSTCRDTVRRSWGHLLNGEQKPEKGFKPLIAAEPPKPM